MEKLSDEGVKLKTLQTALTLMQSPVLAQSEVRARGAWLSRCSLVSVFRHACSASNAHRTPTDGRAQEAVSKPTNNCSGGVPCMRDVVCGTAMAADISQYAVHQQQVVPGMRPTGCRRASRRCWGLCMFAATPDMCLHSLQQVGPGMWPTGWRRACRRCWAFAHLLRT